ncbi:MAG: trehalose-6-phosphate synthase [Gammaproteobacteria bacterium]|nr:trehalose-6-phosphate synthase [Gammaproteobacteria bacterium]
MTKLRLQLRFITPLLVMLIGVAYLTLPLMDKLTLRWFVRDLNLRDELIANSMADSIADALSVDDLPRLHAAFDRVLHDERLVALALCSRDGQLLVRTDAYPDSLTCARAATLSSEPNARFKVAGGRVHVGHHAVVSDGQHLAALVTLHDLSFVAHRSRTTKRYLVAMLAGLGILTSIITVLVARASWDDWIKGTRALLGGDPRAPAAADVAPELAPLADDLRARLRDLEDEFRRALGPEAEWTPDRLRSLLTTQLHGEQVIVVSNREPYIHEYQGERITVRRPASGLVTAIEPVMRACAGTWIAHGSGDADRAVVDEHDCIRVPPGTDDYSLRRVWLTPAQEQGYYYGFANEGLWPLCHVAHVRPVFREDDWARYREVNQIFADAVVREARDDNPLVLVQDYHFALLPALIRERLPRATILIFWHIPWPNPESFGICPWRRELLQGMLGSTIVGFHTRFHCKNFLETVDRYLEARIEHEHSTISHQNDETRVESYPISIAWPSAEQDAAQTSPAACRAAVVARLGLPPDARIALGIDRLDYTKGILERLNAVERLLEKYPQWQGQFVLVQIAAPSRSSLDEYRNFETRLREHTAHINARFGRDAYQPVVLVTRHHDQEAVTELYRAADVCLVTSLHDGMNLVCKEFVAARDDERGVLILSRFAGAAREMTEALVVNPYHIEETADALARALTMPDGEQRERMLSLRTIVREYNVFRWAGRMLTDASRARLRQRVEARVQRHTGLS